MYQLEIISPNMSTICFDDGDEGPPAWYPSVDPPKSHWENMSKCWNVGIFPMEMATFGEYVYCIILYYIILYYIIWYYIVLYDIILSYIIWYYIILYDMILYYIILYI
jgi:hypothetical protein